MSSERSERTRTEAQANSGENDVAGNRRCRRVAIIGSGLAMLLGFLTVIAWATGMTLLASIRSRYIPMAPSTALAFLFLSLGLLALVAARDHTSRRIFAWAGGGLATAVGLLKLVEFSSGVHFGIEEMLARNPAMFGHVPTGRMSPLTAIADLGTGRLTYANAGHPSPLHLHSYRTEVESITRNGNRGPAMGLLQDAHYRSLERPLYPGDFLVLFTDGLFEVDGPGGELYSQERLLGAIQRRTGMDREKLLTEVVGEVKDFSVTQTFEDDVCLVGMEVTRLCSGDPACRG